MEGRLHLNLIWCFRTTFYKGDVVKTVVCGRSCRVGGCVQGFARLEETARHDYMEGRLHLTLFGV